MIVDAPATGHGIALLRAPRTFADIARVGPIRRHADRIDAFIRDPAQTAVVAVALAEEMPVNETIDLEERLRDELGVELAAVLVNAVLPERFSGAEAEAHGRGRRRRLAGRARGARRGAGRPRARRAHQRAQVGAPAAGDRAPVATLPVPADPGGRARATSSALVDEPERRL